MGRDEDSLAGEEGVRQSEDLDDQSGGKEGSHACGGVRGHRSDSGNFIPKRLADYREQEYWERRYEQDQTRHYEWLLSYGDTLRSLLKLKPTDRVLILGCGNSRTPPVE